MRRLVSLALIGGLVTSVAARAEQTSPGAPVVVELFTSEGCSSCPPADALLTELARKRADVLPLAFHVTYWDYLGWHDPYSLQAATDRQRAYSRLLAGEGVYTPQMVVDGASGFVGSDKAAALDAIERARVKPVTVTAIRDGVHIRIDVGAGSGVAQVLVIGFDPSHQTPIGRGENAGRTLTESNIVRAIVPVGAWSGTATSFSTTVPDGEAGAVLLQTSTGRIIGAARIL